MFQVYALAGSEPSSVSVASPLNEITSPARNVSPSCGVRIVGVGAEPTLITIGGERVELTPSETVSLAVNFPAWTYRWVGLAADEVEPSPNVHE